MDGKCARPAIAQGRARGFQSVVKKYPKIEVLDTQPGDWDVTKVARIWETYLTKYPKISAAYFHNDDMALAAYNVMKTHNRTEIKIGGCDAMPPALTAVADGRMLATVRNPSCRIHGGAIVAGVAAVTTGEKTGAGIPKNIVTDGPVSATVTDWLTSVDWLPWASVTCADTVAVPLASVTASAEGIVAVQLPPVPTVAV